MNQCSKMWQIWSISLSAAGKSRVWSDHQTRFSCVTLPVGWAAAGSPCFPGSWCSLVPPWCCLLPVTSPAGWVQVWELLEGFPYHHRSRAARCASGSKSLRLQFDIPLYLWESYPALISFPSPPVAFQIPSSDRVARELVLKVCL